MTEMIRRVAESQAEFDGRSLIHMPRFERERYMARARAAITAMREPTPGMLDEAGRVEVPRWSDGPDGEDYNAPLGSYEAGGAWAAMIDAALSEQV